MGRKEGRHRDIQERQEFIEEGVQNESAGGYDGVSMKRAGKRGRNRV